MLHHQQQQPLAWNAMVRVWWSVWLFSRSCGDCFGRLVATVGDYRNGQSLIRCYLFVLFLFDRATTDGIREVCRVFRLFHDTRHHPVTLRRVAALRRLLHRRHRRRRLLHRPLPARRHRPDC